MRSSIDNLEDRILREEDLGVAKSIDRIKLVLLRKASFSKEWVWSWSNSNDC